MTRLAKKEIERHRATLEVWQTPSAMLKRARRLMDHMGDEDLFNQPGVDFITDAWGAAQFGKGRHVLAVRLVPQREQWPDFEIRTRRRTIERWEFTEVDKPRRRRGLEMRRMAHRRAAGRLASEGERWEQLMAQAERVPRWIKRRCRAKAKKFYAGRAGLLVYLNWSDYGARRAEIEGCFIGATAPAKNAFTEVWVLWGARLYRTWRDGNKAELVLNAPGTHDAYAAR